MLSRGVSVAALLLSAVTLTSCATDASSGGSPASGDRRGCEIPGSLTRLSGPPFGVVLPSGRFASQSYPSAQAIADAGLNAVSIGIPFYYSDSGDIVFGRRGETKEQWLEQIRCTVVEAKEAGLIVLAWGQFIAADAPPGEEPMGVPADLQARLGPAILPLVPDLAAVLEEARVEYFSPVSELDKYVGYPNHNAVFADLVSAARTTYTGTLYAQPNTLARPPSFDSEGVAPDFGGVDALSIAWISFGCRDDDIERAQWYVDQARIQGVREAFIGEIGGVTAGSPADEPCLQKLIDRWDGSRNGVMVLDAPSDIPGAAQVAGGWQEDVLRQLVRTPE